MASASTTVSRSARWGACSTTVRGEPPRQPVVDLDGDHVPGHLEQRQRQRAQAGPDLEDHVVWADARVPDDPAHRVAVDDEVLPALLAGSQVELVGEAPDLGGTEQAHRGPGHGPEASRGLVGQRGRPRAAEQCGQAPYPPQASRSRVATAICASRLWLLGRPVPPYACQVPRLNWRPP